MVVCYVNLWFRRQFNKLQLITLFRPLGHPLCVDESGVFSVNLWLSPQGLWYYRKVTVLPVVVIKSGRRNGIKHPCQPETSWQPVQVVNILS